jgi:hypothetical protein
MIADRVLEMLKEMGDGEDGIEYPVDAEGFVYNLVLEAGGECITGLCWRHRDTTLVEALFLDGSHIHIVIDQDDDSGTGEAGLSWKAITSTQMSDWLLETEVKLRDLIRQAEKALPGIKSMQDQLGREL